jgi:hypothetical protein
MKSGRRILRIHHEAGGHFYWVSSIGEGNVLSPWPPRSSKSSGQGVTLQTQRAPRSTKPILVMDPPKTVYRALHAHGDSEIEVIAQEVFLRAYIIERCRLIEQLKSFLFHIAKRLAPSQFTP